MQSQNQNSEYQSLINTTLFVLDSLIMSVFYQCLPTTCYVKNDSYNFDWVAIDPIMIITFHIWFVPLENGGFMGSNGI